MMLKFMGEENFKKGIAAYLEEMYVLNITNNLDISHKI